MRNLCALRSKRCAFMLIRAPVPRPSRRLKKKEKGKFNLREARPSGMNYRIRGCLPGYGAARNSSRWQGKKGELAIEKSKRTLTLIITGCNLRAGITRASCGFVRKSDTKVHACVVDVSFRICKYFKGALLFPCAVT